MELAKWGDRDTKRSNLLAVGREILEVEGYSGLKLREVAKRAGVSPGTVYQIFPDKEALFATLYVDRLEEFYGEVVTKIERNDTPEGLFVEVGIAYVDVYKVYGRYLDLAALLISPDQWPAELVNQLMSVTLRLLSLLSPLFSQFGVDALSAEARRKSGILVWSMFNGLAEQYSGQRASLHGIPAKELFEFSAQVILSGIRQQSDN